MIIPIQCFSCGRIIANSDYIKVKELIKKNKADPNFSLIPEFEKMGIHRYCCRMAIVSSIDVSDFIQKK